ncbi:M20 family metallo-hydrolase [Aureispira anguillae]|uniref:M20 family metallo-hydrolase n=1 Tax=Aureispira anguillae TaxID=2864201 RepID=A0A915YAH6_9BACT|nr:M20 family metallo-hydrolase [Aureispira anguillae]BDS09707.1 M20 family metallo-hydrolase [Aureispira anguillae]
MPNQKLIQRVKRIAERIEILAHVSEEPNNLVRTYGSQALDRANQLVVEWMQAAGLKTTIDTIGNVRGRLPATNNSNKVFVMGSHLDTVKNAGKYDGPLGLLIALDVVEELGKTHKYRPFNIEVVGFCDEEGVRFTTTYLGSSALSNTFQESWLDLRDDAGISLAEVIQEKGGDVQKIQEESLSSDECLGYYEVHIEQGPVLENETISVGVVTSIAAQTRVDLRFIGKAGHAGTTPMDARQDALCAAADFITAVENYSKLSDQEITATVGKLTVEPNVSNVIPNEVHCSLDLRSPNNQGMYLALEELEGITANFCEKRKIDFKWTVLQQNEAVFFDPYLYKLLEEAVLEVGMPKLVRLTSGAGHDAVALSPIMPVSMLFIQCKDGISHHPDEFVAFEHIKDGVCVSDCFVAQLIASYQKQPILQTTINS